MLILLFGLSGLIDGPQAVTRTVRSAIRVLDFFIVISLLSSNVKSLYFSRIDRVTARPRAVAHLRNLHMRLDIQVDAQGLFAVDDCPASAVIEMFDTFRVAALDKFVHYSVAAVADGETEVVHSVSVFFDELVVGARIIVDDLV